MRATLLGDAYPGVDERDVKLIPALRDYHSALYRCAECDLVFRFPMLDDETLGAIYRHMPVTEWTYEHRTYWDWTKDAIARWAPNKKILDVGCFRGDFLASLGAGFEPYGVEPNKVAAKVASDRGVRIIGNFATDDLSEHGGQFGAIVMMDVIEHVPDPVAVLDKLKPLLAPDGILIVLTGDSCSWSARLSLPFYWYMVFPIHLVYLGNNYMRWLEHRLKFKRLAWKRMAHDEVGIFRRTRQAVGCIATHAWRHTLRKNTFLRTIGVFPPFRTIRNYNGPPTLMGLRDHFWTVLRIPK